MSVDGDVTPTQLSSPRLPVDSPGSSISTTMQEEYNELLKYSVVIPQFDPKIGPQVLENAKGLFITTTKQIQIKQHLEQQKAVSKKMDDKNTSNLNNSGGFNTSALRILEKKEADKNNINNNLNLCDVINNKNHDDTLEGMSTSINSSASFDSFSPKANGLLIPAVLTANNNNTNPNLYYHLESNFTSITNDVTRSPELGFINNNNIYNNNNNNNNIEDHNITNDEIEQLNNNNNNNIVNDNDNNINMMMSTINTNTTTNSNNNDINPRKHSPVPISPPANIDYDATNDNSIDILLNANQQNNKLAKHYFSHYYQQYSDGAHYSQNRQQQQQQQQHSTNGNVNQSKVNNSLDKLFKEFKSHVLTELEKSRLQLLEEQQKRLIEEKEKQASDILKLQQEIELLKENLNEHEKNTERKDSVIANLSKALEKQREKTEVQRVMLEWKIKKAENSREVFTTKIAENFHDFRVKSKVFSNWRSIFLNHHKSKVEKACKKKAEEICMDLANKYEEKVKKLENELKKSKEEIDSYKYEMNKCEENMKRALMRGVCALNLEAMSIFNDENVVVHNTKKPLNTHNMPVRNDAYNSATYHSDDDLKQQKNSNNEEIIEVINEPSNDIIAKTQEKLFKSSLKTSFNTNNRKLTEQQSSTVGGSNTTNGSNSSKTQIINCDSKQTLSNSQIPAYIIDKQSESENQSKYAKVYSHLSEHNFTHNKQRNAILNKNVKAKVNSNSNSTFPLRSIIIEKHTKNSFDDDSKQQYKYLPNTVLTPTNKNTTLIAQSSSSAPSSAAPPLPPNRLASNAKKSLLIKCSN